MPDLSSPVLWDNGAAIASEVARIQAASAARGSGGAGGPSDYGTGWMLAALRFARVAAEHPVMMACAGLMLLVLVLGCLALLGRFVAEGV